MDLCLTICFQPILDVDMFTNVKIWSSRVCRCVLRQVINLACLLFEVVSRLREWISGFGKKFFFSQGYAKHRRR